MRALIRVPTELRGRPRASRGCRSLCATLLSMCVAGFLAQPVAAAKPKRLNCINKGGTEYVFKRKPKACGVFGPGGSFGGGVDLRQLKWKGWGTKSARATGIECGFRADCSDIPVTVRAYRLRTCGSRRVYTRLRARSTFGTSTVAVPRCPRRA